MTSATPKPRAGEHVPGPWKAAPHRSGTQIRADDLIICSGMSEANARRIVACVNACEGLSTEALERSDQYVGAREPIAVRDAIDVRGEICKIVSRMLDNPDKYGIYPTTRCYDELEAFVRDYAKIQLALAKHGR